MVVVLEEVQADKPDGPGHSATSRTLCRHENVKIGCSSVAHVVDELNSLTEILRIAFVLAIDEYF
jgi:hypothetical protein